MNRSHVIEALRAADWSNTPIGNKALIQAAIEHLEAQPSSAFRPARVISYRPGMGEVTVYTAGGVPGYMNIGDTVYVSDRAPVEHAGGDERAAFELFVRKHCGMPEHIAVNWDAKFTNDAWEGWKARAALAQHSPVPTLRAAIDVANDRFEVPVAKWGTDLAGEEGRPEIEEVSEFEREDIARSAFETAMTDGISLDSFLSLSNTLAARYERIVGALRAENAKLEKELAMARDAALKGDDARHAAGGMEMEIQELRENVAKLKKELRSRWTYASTQSTNCAGCGEHKHTPLRVDWMGGYVCLTCIDEKLEALHGAQAQHGLPDDDTILQIFADNADHSEQGDEDGYCIVREQHALKIARELLAAAPASSEES
ncbi:hypothetical protein [Pseudomonas aeruginosa]|uniref:hypothetical protein n=1 Tax=Pseudomonas aeruginosa TaxID=287 RepID=UPI00301C6AD8